ncbi:MAG: ferritin family protein [Thermodesulfobacteriota bacterium]
MFVFGNAEDVFAMAVRIEENGNAFYTGAMKRANDPGLKKLFEDLAAMEEGHIAAFKALRAEVIKSSPAIGVWDPEGLAEAYLQVTADSHIFTLEEATSRLAKIRSVLDALDVALQFERDSVAFFVGMQKMLPDVEGKNKIDVLIQSEMDHIRMISAVKKRFASGGEPSLF